MGGNRTDSALPPPPKTQSLGSACGPALLPPTYHNQPPNTPYFLIVLSPLKLAYGEIEISSDVFFLFQTNFDSEPAKSASQHKP